MVSAAVEELPPRFLQRLENLQFVVEELARPDDYPVHGPGQGTLLGVYRGVPLTGRTSGYHLTLPDRIVLFRAPLQQLARDRSHLAALVRHTVRHEIAHHFGISDQRLGELGAY